MRPPPGVTVTPQRVEGNRLVVKISADTDQFLAGLREAERNLKHLGLHRWLCWKLTQAIRRLGP